MPPAPKPKHLRQNRIKRPEIGIVPASKRAQIPKPPTGLLAKSRRVWRQYWSSQVSNTADQNADAHRIQRWIVAVDEYERCISVFRKTRLVRGSTGQPVLNPLASYLSSLETTISKAELELGLTPLARLKLGVAYGEAQMTALELNRQLDKELQAELRELEAWEAEWQEA